MMAAVPQDALDGLIAVLDLEPIEVNYFRGISPDDHRQRVFGGQVAGQALVAASRTVEPTLSVHSLHAYFLRPGDPAVPILYDVDRIRDGRSFVTRRVVAVQHGQAIFNLAASFHKHEPGLDHQFPMPDVPAPDELPTWQDQWAPWRHLLGDFWARPRAIEVRYVDFLPPDRVHGAPPRQRVWFRADGVLPDDPVLHACVVTYASDLTLVDTTLVAHGSSTFDQGIMMASLDHAMWFHRPFRADEWLLYDQDSPSAGGARGLARGLDLHRRRRPGGFRRAGVSDPGGHHVKARALFLAAVLLLGACSGDGRRRRRGGDDHGLRRPRTRRRPPRSAGTAAHAAGGRRRHARPRSPRSTSRWPWRPGPARTTCTWPSAPAECGASTSHRPGPNAPYRYRLAGSAVLDLTDDILADGTEQGLLGITFSSDGRPPVRRLHRPRRAAVPRRVRPWTERPSTRAAARTLLAVPDFAANHNGGQLAFGPDGFLYWGMGDGGGGGDPEGTGQNPDDLLGSILRIDPDGGDPYACPSTTRSPGWRRARGVGLWLAQPVAVLVRPVDRRPVDRRRRPERSRRGRPSSRDPTVAGGARTSGGQPGRATRPTRAAPSRKATCRRSWPMGTMRAGAR